MTVFKGFSQQQPAFSLAGGLQQPQAFQPVQLDTSMLLKDMQPQQLNLQGLGPNDGLAGSTQGQGMGGGFFTQGNSTMQNIGEGLGLAGGVASLASVLDNWGVAKDAMQLNMANVRQQMGNNQEAFDRSKGRQDRSLAAVNSANDRAQAIQGQQPQVGMA